jgi:hypothetical protein
MIAAALRRLAAAGLAVAALLAVCSPAAAQLPRFEPLPTWTPADTTARLDTHIALDRFGDGRTGWTADRLLVDARLPFGRHGCLFLRLPCLRFDAASMPAALRWPGISGPAAGAGWPGESVVTGVGQLEIGAAGPLALPGLGTCQLAVACGVPLGHGRFYPFSTSGLPLRLGLTRWLPLAGPWWFGAGGVLVAHGGQGDDVLDTSAFPDGTHLALTVASPSLRAGWEARDRAGRREQVVSIEGSLAWGAAERVGLRAEREISGSSDRAAAWSAGVFWRLGPRPVGKTAAGPKPAAR